MRNIMSALAATSLLIAMPAAANGDDRQDKSRQEAREKAEREKECEPKKRTERVCKPSVPIRDENKTPGPLDRAYNAPFF
ncbi:hypothetical protein [Sphingomicrobium flavum]|uniref:hypothetical protein n=1 Tax=Sphingomicrobium flavum TaxID=1229164 RepID=UPI0021AE2E9B|nr:hypothetical protein [Sphingomicrobium flavum]